MYAFVTIKSNTEKGFLLVPEKTVDQYLIREGDVLCRGHRVPDHQVQFGARVSLDMVGKPLTDYISLGEGEYYSCWTKSKPPEKVFVPKSTFHSKPLPLP